MSFPATDGDHNPNGGWSGKGTLPATRWTLISMLRDGSDEQRLEAKRVLYETYSRPVYLFLLSRGCSHEDARDITHDVFVPRVRQIPKELGKGGPSQDATGPAKNLSSPDGRDPLADAKKDKGRLRSFIWRLATCRHLDFLRKKNRTGPGGQDEERWESPDASEATTHPELGPEERAFYQIWAKELADRVRQELEREYAARGKSRVFAALWPFLRQKSGSSAGGEHYAAAANLLGITEEAVKTAVFRLRQRFASRFRSEVSLTLASPADVEEELNLLISYLGEALDEGGLC